MHQALEEIQGQLKEIIAQLKATLGSDEPLGIAHNNWTFPMLTRSELVEEAQSIINMIDSNEVDDLGDSEARIKDYVRRLVYIRQQSIPNIWGNPIAGVSVYVSTLDGLRKALTSVLVRDDRAEAVAALRKITRQLRGMEASLNGLTPRTASLTAMVERIEQACNAADQLPADLEMLYEARQKIADLVKDATRDHSDISSIREAANELDRQLNNSADEAKAVLERCETAYSAATSVGLAAAFNERSDALSISMWIWVVGLIIALATGSYFGSAQLHALSELFKAPNVSLSVIVLNFVLSVLSIGAPVWFAWLSTKQIGQRFRLAEDYAFKASISRAYEGFRREAARIDKDMEAKLLASALTRLDELPLRLVETASHGSPWHELATSDIVKQAIKVVPGFTEQVRDLAGKAIAAATPDKSPSAAKTKPAPAQENDE
jgi:hypothetical protein